MEIQTEEVLSKKLWPDRGVFLQNKQEYLEKNRPLWTAEFQQLYPELPPQALDILVSVFSAAMAAGTFLVEHAPISINNLTTLGYAVTPQTEDYGFAQPTIQLSSGEIIADFEHTVLSPTELAQATLLHLSAGLELDRVISDVELLLEYARHSQASLHKNPELSDEVIAQRTQAWLESDIAALSTKLETIMIHEVAHLLYFADAFAHPAKLQAWMKSDQSEGFPTFSDQRWEKYYAKPEEYRARLWEHSFLRKYYPDSGLIQEKKTQLQKAKDAWHRLKAAQTPTLPPPTF